MCFNIIWLQEQRRLKLAHRIVQASGHGHQGPAQLSVRLDILRINPQRLVVLDNGVVHMTGKR